VTGAEHYRRAEQLIAEAREAIAPREYAYPLKPGEPTSAELYKRNIAEAQVNAILALAAAPLGFDSEQATSQPGSTLPMPTKADGTPFSREEIRAATDPQDPDDGFALT
jgi:hypothetical protein